MKVILDVDREEDRIIARFIYHPDLPNQMKQVVGTKLKGKGKNPHPEEAYYYTKLDISIAKDFRRVFGDGLRMTDQFRAWAKNEGRQASILRSMSLSEDAELTVIPDEAPELYQLLTKGHAVTLLGEQKPKDISKGKPRPFQRADIKFAAERGVSCNFNHAGLGKTIETIGAIYESGFMQGFHLIVCPVVSKDLVWAYEWNSWVEDVPILVTPQGRGPRQAMLSEAVEMYEADEPFALVVNPAMIKMKSQFEYCSLHEKPICRVCDQPRGEDHFELMGHKYRSSGKGAKVHELRMCEMCKEVLVPEFPELFKIDWDWIVLDEIQKMGVYNLSSMTAKALVKLPFNNKLVLSSTPFAGRAIHVYHILHLMDPKAFSNKMEFAERWLNVTRNKSPFASDHSVVVGELKSCRRHPQLKSDEDTECPDCQAIRKPFWEMLATHAVRRTKKEYLKDLPDKLPIDIWVPMTEAQQQQYDSFAAEAELDIAEYELSAVGILAINTRLKQFANAVQEVEVLEPATEDSPAQIKLKPTRDSNKLPAIMEILDNLGIATGEPVGGEYEKAVIFSESTEMVKMIRSWLVDEGIPAEEIHGGTSQKERERLVNQFQNSAEPRVMVLNTKAAGFSINLDRASTVIFVDETWNPDDQEQAEDRCHRGSRMHQVTVYYIRSEGTIQGQIKETVLGKSRTNTRIMDMKKGLKGGEESNS